MVSGYEESVVFFVVWSQTADVVFTEAHKRREKVRGGERVDGIRNSTTSKGISMWLL